MSKTLGIWLNSFSMAGLAQWQVLAYLARNEGIYQAGLAELLEIEPATLGRIVDKLQVLGL